MGVGTALLYSRLLVWQRYPPSHSPMSHPLAMRIPLPILAAGWISAAHTCRKRTQARTRHTKLNSMHHRDRQLFPRAYHQEQGAAAREFLRHCKKKSPQKKVERGTWVPSSRIGPSTILGSVKTRRKQTTQHTYTTRSETQNPHGTARSSAGDTSRIQERAACWRWPSHD